MRHVLAGLALLALVPGPLGGARAGAEEDLPTRSHHLGALAAPALPAAPDGFGLARPAGAPVLWPSRGAEEPVVFCSPDSLVELIRAGVSPATWESVEGADLRAAHDRLLVTAPPAVQAEVEALLGRLWAEAARRVEVVARWVRVPVAGPPPAGGPLDRAARGRLEEAEVAALLEEARRVGGSVSTASTVLRPGVWGRVGEADRVSYVGELEVEIAQASVVGDPVVLQADDGWAAEVRCVPLRDGSVWLEALAERSDLERPVRSLPTEALALGSVDLPAAHVVRLVTAARLPAGRTLAVVARSPSRPDVVHVLLLQPLAASRAAAAPGPRRFDLTALAQTPLEFGFVGHREEVGHGAHHAPLLVGPEEGATVASAPEWLERLRSEVSPEAWDLEGTWASSNEGAIFALGPAALLDRADRWLAEREADTLRSARLRCTVSEAEGDGPWRETGGLALDVALGRDVCAQAGVERLYLADWGVEVAQEARVGDPVVGTAFGGLWANLRVEATPVADEYAVRLDGGLHALAASFDLRRPRNDVTGVLEVPRAGHAPLRADLVLAVGKPVVLEGLGDDARRRRLEMRLEP